MVKNSDDSINEPSKRLSPPTDKGVVVDIGTGDGRFVYQCAHLNPHRFYIGIDTNPRPQERISRKIYRKPAKGGLPNTLFLQAAVEAIPPESDGQNAPPMPEKAWQTGNPNLRTPPLTKRTFILQCQLIVNMLSQTG